MSDADTPVRVLVVTNGWPTERFPEYAVFNRRQVENLRRLGATVDVEFVNAREYGKGEYLKRVPRLARRARGYDIVHCFHGLSLLLSSLAGVRGSRVVSFQNAVENEFVDLPGPLEALALRWTRRMLRAGGSNLGIILKDRVPDFLRDNPLARYIPNGIDLDVFTPGDRAAARATLGLNPDALYLLFVSSKNLDRPQKRHDRFMDVLAAYRAAHPDRQVEPLRLVSEPADRVLLTYRAADVHVMTSDFEGSPNSVKEALACALPVVSTDVGNVSIMLQGLAAARVATPYSPAGFVAAIDAVLDQPPSARPALRAALFTQGLDAETSASRVIDLYRAVIARTAV